MNLAERLEPRPVFEKITQAARSTGVPAWVIGGWVRDRLLEDRLRMPRPSKDVDIVCLGDGIALAEAFATLLPGQPEVIVFKTFGTAMVRTGDFEVEFVGARKESYRHDSRKPDVEPGTLEDDQGRRDFTVNALAISLNEADFGTLLDPFGGLADMDARMLRTPLEPALTFSDDPLRMMRAARFAAQLGFDIDPDTFEAMKEMAPRLSIVSAERITDELNKTILSAKPGYGFKVLYFAGLLQQVLPELVALAGVEYVEGKGHKDNFFHTLEVLENVIQFSDGKADLWLRWAALLHDIAKPATKRFDKKQGWTFHGHEELGARWVPRIFRRLKLPLGAEMKRVENLVRLHLRPISLVNEQVTDSAVRRLMADAGPDMEDLMMLCRADVTTKNPNKAQRYLKNFDLVEEKMARVSEEDKIRNFQPVLTGNDIMVALNLKPGPQIGVIKEQIREDILDGKLPNTYEACLARMWELARAAGYTD